MTSKTRIADYFFVTSVHIDKNNLEMDNPNPEILDRFPEKDYEDVPFTENAEFFCLPEGAKVEHIEEDRRKPYIFTFCFTQSFSLLSPVIYSDGSQSFGTSLVFYEKLMIHNQECYNKYHQELYIPKALCILSLKPFFSLHSSFLKLLFRKAMPSYTIKDDVTIVNEEVNNRMRLRRNSSSFHINQSLVYSQKGEMNSLVPIERDIRYYIEALPYIQPGCCIHIPLFGNDIQLLSPPEECLPFCDELCMKSLMNCLSLNHIQVVVSTLLRDGKILMHSRNKYQLTLCSTALLALLQPIHYTFTFIPLLPAQLMDYVEAPTPYLIGIYSTTFALNQQESINALIVHLDYDYITYPEGYNSLPIELPFIESYHLDAPLTYKMIWTDKPNSKAASSCIFTITAGPGRLGLKLRQEGRQLVYCPPGSTVALEEVTYIDSEESQKLGGIIGNHITDCMLLGQNPAIIEVNGVPVVGLSLKRVSIIIASASRPITISLQVGLRDIPDTYNESQTAVVLNTNLPNTKQSLLYYYEDVRIAFFTFFVCFFRTFDNYFNVEDNEMNFDSKRFIKSLPSSVQQFGEEFVNNQLFEGLKMTLLQLHNSVNMNDTKDTKENKDDNEVDIETRRVIHLLHKCISILNKYDEAHLEDGIQQIREYLHPKNWNLTDVRLPIVDNGKADDNVLEVMAGRSTNQFPRLSDICWGNRIGRFTL